VHYRRSAAPQRLANRQLARVEHAGQAAIHVLADAVKRIYLDERMLAWLLLRSGSCDSKLLDNAYRPPGREAESMATVQEAAIAAYLSTRISPFGVNGIIIIAGTLASITSMKGISASPTVSEFELMA
jgi:hypothetical protein